MYAKLVYNKDYPWSGTGSYSTNGFMEGGQFTNVCRDIVRLLTSSAPSISTCISDSRSFSKTASMVIDSTPAGWTYVGSNIDGNTLPSITTIEASGYIGSDTPGAANGMWSIQAPTSDDTQIKTVVIGQATANAAVSAGPTGGKHDYMVSRGMYLTGAIGSTCTGNASTFSVTGIGTYPKTPSWNNDNPMAWLCGRGGKTAIGTYHLIANNRHVTLIREGAGMTAIWEFGNTDVHTALNAPPMVYLNWISGASNALDNHNGGPYLTTSPLQVSQLFKFTSLLDSTYSDVKNIGGVSNITNVNTAASAFGSFNPFFFPWQSLRTPSMSATGMPRNLVNPILLQGYNHGYPSMFITGTTPVYMAGGSIGSVGDTVNINGNTYYYFPVIPTTVSYGPFGIAIKLS